MKHSRDRVTTSSRYSTVATHLGFAFLILSLLSVSSCLAVSLGFALVQLGCVSFYSSSSVYALCCLRVSLLCCCLAGTTSGGRRETPSYRSSTTPPPVSRRGTGGGRLARSWKRRGWPHRRYKRASGYVFINHAPFLARRFVQQRFLRLRVHSVRVDLAANSNVLQLESNWFDCLRELRAGQAHARPDRRPKGGGRGRRCEES